jgi:hypothetical protein
LARGVGRAIATGYLELARHLAGARRIAAAMRELEEGVDVLAGGTIRPDESGADALRDEIGVLSRRHCIVRSSGQRRNGRWARSQRRP